MAWKPIEQLNESKRRAVLQGILAGAIPSYVDERGQRHIWMSGKQPPLWSLELVAKVRQQVADMKRQAMASGRQTRPAPQPMRRAA